MAAVGKITNRLNQNQVLAIIHLRASDTPIHVILERFNIHRNLVSYYCRTNKETFLKAKEQYKNHKHILSGKAGKYSHIIEEPVNEGKMYHEYLGKKRDGQSRL